jgi:intracellular septation protein
MNWIFGAIEELLPVLTFFIAQAYFGFQIGLLSMTGTLVVLLVFTLRINQSVPRFALISTVAFLLFAVPSMLTGNSSYFQLSDTVLDGLFALLLLCSWFAGYPLLKVLFGSIFAISDRAWQILSLRWGLLFFCLAGFNEYIRVFYSDELWSWYKLLSTIGIILFGCYQFKLSMSERLPGESNKFGLRLSYKAPERK